MLNGMVNKKQRHFSTKREGKLHLAPLWSKPKEKQTNMKPKKDQLLPSHNQTKKANKSPLVPLWTTDSASNHQLCLWLGTCHNWQILDENLFSFLLTWELLLMFFCLFPSNYNLVTWESLFCPPQQSSPPLWDQTLVTVGSRLHKLLGFIRSVFSFSFI